MGIKHISQPRFDSLCFMRLARGKIFHEEREWYADEKENVLGVVILDRVDNDWSYVILGRDERARFSAIDSDTCHRTVNEARIALHKKMEKFAADGEQVFHQGINNKKQKTFQIFKPIVAREKLHHDFIVIAESNGYSSAREIMKEIAYTYEDTDGNYIQQFQTTGFDARVWELYLYAVLHEMDFEIDRNYRAPDYVCTSFKGEVILEATTANSTLQKKDVELGNLNSKELQDFLAIKFGSALYSKIQKRYWEKDHVKDHPFVLAVADFRKPEWLVFSGQFLMHYLYGVCQQSRPDGVSFSSIKEHTYAGKTIPSGFFHLPDAKHVSAVLFSDSGTIAKFNRMGKIAGFGDHSVIMARVGQRFPKSDSERPEPFRVLVEAKYREKWAEGIWIFHNPNAQIPLASELFPDVAHVYFENGGCVIYLADTFPIWSKTLIFSTEDDWRRFSVKEESRPN